MNTKYPLTTLALLVGAFLYVLPASADWILIEDFERFADGEDVGGDALADPPVLPLFPTATGGGAIPYFNVYSESLTDPTANKGYFADWGDNPAGGSDTWVSIPLIEEIEEGTYSTIYMRHYVTGYSNRWHWGATQEVGLSQEDPPGAFLTGWSQHANILRWASPDGLFAAHTGGTYRDNVDSYKVDLDVWTEFWVIYYNGVLASDKTWRVYYRGPNDTDPILMTFDPDNPTDLLTFRNTNPGSLKALILATNNTATEPNNRDFYMIDDIYQNNFDSASEIIIGDPRIDEVWSVDYDTGAISQDTGSTKGPGIFADLDMDGNGWVETDWYGFVNTNFYPWCYSFTADAFFFATGTSTTDPVWIYILR